MDNKFELLTNQIIGQTIYRQMEIEWKDKFIVVKCEYREDAYGTEWTEEYSYQIFNKETEEYDEFEIDNPKEFFGEDFKDLQKFVEDHYSDSENSN